MTDNEMFLIDTNILVYTIDKKERDRNIKAKELIDLCWKGKITYAISVQNLAEFTSVTTNKLKLDYKQTHTMVAYIAEFAGFKKLNYTATTILSAIEIAGEFNISFWDALLAATMKEHHIYNIYTENTKDFKMPWLKAVNPLR